ncbi:MAG: nickel pincer cofactor biosynthesis protein LarB [Selenomonadaceae bacterium]|nr:nickel pincer cofactor biosynthesis protein LarB [Selenomonadaceae bacterium]
MNEGLIRNFLHEYKAGNFTDEEILHKLRENEVEEMGFAKVDLGREVRQGFPEVIYAEGKTPSQVADIFSALSKKSNSSVMATRANAEKFEAVKNVAPEAKYDEAARIVYLERNLNDVDKSRYILVVTAGTSDIPVAEEARLTAYLMGQNVKTCYDCGVAGIHRLFSHLEEIQNANVIIVIAGMEGALASVVGGLTDKPVIAVPTSVGYGASFRGLSALLSMLNSCAAGTSVVNIDNGFGAGVLAAKINKMR